MIKMKQNILLFIVFLSSIFILTSCSNIFSKKFSSSIISSPQDIILYNYSSRNLFTYNIQQQQIVQNEVDANTIQYAFNCPNSPIFTSSTKNKSDFAVLKVEDNELKRIYTMPDNAAIYPLAKQNEENYLMSIQYFDTAGKKLENKSYAGIFNTNTLGIKPILATEGIDILSGVFLEPYFYFTDYNEIANAYRLYRIDTKNADSIPEIIEQDLKSPDIYNDEENVWVSNKTSIYYKNIHFSKKLVNYFHKNYLIQMDIIDDIPTLDIIDINKNVILNSFENALDFKIDGNKLTIYGIDFIQEKYLY